MIVADSNKASAQAMFADRGYNDACFSIQLTDGTNTFWSQEHTHDNVTNALLNSDLLHYVTVTPYFQSAIDEVGLERVLPEIEE